METIVVDYYVASILVSYGQHDIVVFEPRSGDVCKFSDLRWPSKGILKDASEIVKTLGTGGMDNEYTFIWVRIRKP